MKKSAFAKKSKLKKGFTLAEVLVVVAIMGILAAFGFVAVIRYRRNLKAMEMDNTAQEIFLAAQNRLTAAKSTGSWDAYVRAEKNKSGNNNGEALGKSLGSANSTGADLFSDWAVSGTTITGASPDFREVLVSKGKVSYTGSNASVNQDPLMSGYLLPQETIDETVRTSGSYVIDYDAASGTIYSVFYTDDATGLSDADAATLCRTNKGGDYRGNTTANRDKRAHYTGAGSNKNVIVGYYSGGNIEAASSAVTGSNSNLTTILPIKVSIENDDLLRLIIENPNDVSGDAGMHFEINVKGATGGSAVLSFDTAKSGSPAVTIGPGGSGASTGTTYAGQVETVSLTPASNAQIYFLTLDSATTDSASGLDQHFAKLFAGCGFIPGDDLTITVTASADTAHNKVNASVTTNSLFASAAPGANGGKSAQIAYGRHLENLSSEISGVNLNADGTPAAGPLVTDAALIGDINWQQATITQAATDGRMQQTEVARSTTAGLQNVMQFTNTDSTVMAATGKFVGIYNSAVRSFDGSGHTIRNLDIVGDSFAAADNRHYGAAGLFAELNTTADQGLTVSNLTLADTTATAVKPVTAGNISGAGALVGIIVPAAGAESSARPVQISGIKLTTTTANGTDGTEAGGLIGRIETSGKLTVSDVTIEALTVSAPSASGAANHAGGLVGSLIVSGTAPKSVSNINFTDAISVQGSGDAGGMLGGLTGTGAEAVSVSNIKFMNNIAVRGSGTAGGVIGSFVDAKLSLNTVSVNATSIAVTGTNAAGGILGSANAAGTDAQISNATLNADTITVVADNGSAGGFTGGMTFGSIPGFNEIHVHANNSLRVGSDLSVATIDNAHAGGLIGSVTTTDAAGFTASHCTVDGGNDGAVAAFNSAQNGGAAGGLVGFLSGNGSSAISDSYTSVYVQGQGGCGVGGFVGTMSGGGTFQISRSYAAGRTADKNYQLKSDPLTAGNFADTNAKAAQGRFNVDHLNAVEDGNLGGAGGFAGNVSGGAQVTIDSCYTTASVHYAAQDAAAVQSGAAGGFIGRISTGAAVTVGNSYTTAFVRNGGDLTAKPAGNNIGAFVGNVSGGTVSSAAGQSNYYLLGVLAANGSNTIQNDLTAAVGGSADNTIASGAVIDTEGTPFKAPSKAASATPYDQKLTNTYPWTAVTSGYTATSALNHVGDWPQTGEVQTSDQDFGFVYYEILSDDTKQAKTIYYHGFVGGTFDVNQHKYFYNTHYSEIKTNENSSYVPDDITLNANGLPINRGKYVSEDGYMILIKDTADITNTYVGFLNVVQFNDTAKALNTSGESWNPGETANIYLHDSKKFTDYFTKLEDAAGNNYAAQMGLNGYTAYIFKDADITNYCLQSSAGGTVIGFWENQNPDQNKQGNWRGDPIQAVYTFHPYFADTLKIGTEDSTGLRMTMPNVGTAQADGSTLFGIRSARQLWQILKNQHNANPDYINNPSSNYTIEQQLDITYDTQGKGVHFTSCGQSVSELWNSSATISQFANSSAKVTLRSANATSDGSTTYILDGLTSPFANNVGANGTIENLHITNMKADDLVDQAAGTIRNVKIDSSEFKNGVVKDANGSIGNCSVAGSTFTGNGFVNTNTGTVTDVAMTNCNVTGNGFGDSNTGTVERCSISNSTIGQNGFANSNTGAVSGVTITSCNISGNGFVNTNTENGNISSCGISNSTIGKDGFANSNSKVISKGEIKNCFISGNGFVTDNKGNIDGCSVSSSTILQNGFVSSNEYGNITNTTIVNAHIGQNGFAGSNSGTIQNCQIYADNDKYQGDTGNFAPYSDTMDPALIVDLTMVDRALRGYNLVTIGLIKNNQNGYMVSESVGGFVGTMQQGLIQNCSVTGKVYGKDNVSGFADTMKSGKIVGCYSNTLLGGFTNGSTNLRVSGFVRDTAQAEISECHSTGRMQALLLGEGDVVQPGAVLNAEQMANMNDKIGAAGFVYHINTYGAVNIANSYSGIWDNGAIPNYGYFYFETSNGLSQGSANNQILITKQLTEQVKVKDARDSGDIKNGKIAALSVVTNPADGFTTSYRQYGIPASDDAQNNPNYPYQMPLMPSGMLMKQYGDWGEMIDQADPSQGQSGSDSGEQTGTETGSSSDQGNSGSGSETGNTGGDSSSEQGNSDIENTKDASVSLTYENGWDGHRKYNITIKNNLDHKVDSITVTLKATGNVTGIAGNVTGTVNGDVVTITANNYGNGFKAEESQTFYMDVLGTGDFSVSLN